jgi:urease accessory protein
VIENMLHGLGATVKHVMEPFTPEAGAYDTGTHSLAHSHDHGHSRDHSPGNTHEQDDDTHVGHHHD